MDLAPALSGYFTICFAGPFVADDRRSAAHTLVGTGIKAPRIRGPADAGRSGSSHGIQDPELRRLSKPSLALHAASGESRHLPSRTGYDAAPPARCEAHFDRLDAFLSGAFRSGREWMTAKTKPATDLRGFRRIIQN